jgi:hypothetical protein
MDAQGLPSLRRPQFLLREFRLFNSTHFADDFTGTFGHAHVCSIPFSSKLCLIAKILAFVVNAVFPQTKRNCRLREFQPMLSTNTPFPSNSDIERP